MTQNENVSKTILENGMKVFGNGVNVMTLNLRLSNARKSLHECESEIKKSLKELDLSDSKSKRMFNNHLVQLNGIKQSFLKKRSKTVKK